MSEILPSIERETGPNPSHSVILLHGLGANGNDFAPIVPELAGADWPALRFVFPHAPTRPVTINGGMAMPAWYDILGIDLHQRQDEAGMRASIAAVEALIEREIQRGVPAQHIVLAGFSQGGAIALAAGLRHTQALGGIVALSTYLPMAGSLADERSAANAAVPIFQAHGTADPVVPLARGEDSREAMQALGYRVDWHTYPMAHSVCPQEITDLRAWLEPRLR